nr:hypothetical protein [Tanacetum cinerariifolium]
MSRFSIVSESTEKGKKFLFRWRGKECLVEISVLDDVKEDFVSLVLLSHSGINPHVCGTDLDSMSQFSLVSESTEKGKKFLFRWRGKECLIEISVLDDVKDDFVSLVLLSHSGINPHVCGTDLDSVSFGNQCLFMSNMLNFLLTYDST